MCRMGPADVIARVLIGLEDKFGSLVLWCEPWEGMKTEDANKALVQMLLALALCSLNWKAVVICRMGRADVIARALIGLEGEFEGQLDFVVRAAESMRTEDVTDAWVQVSSALATMDRPDIMTDVRSQTGLVLAHVFESTKQCI